LRCSPRPLLEIGSFGRLWSYKVSSLRDPVRRRRLRIAAIVYAGFTAAGVWAASPALLAAHTDANHFALLAEAFLRGRLDLGGPAPAYTGNNDFALYADKTWVVFPPFPALLLLPFVALTGRAEAVPDGLLFLLLAGLAPALLFLSLEKLCELGDSARSERENIVLAGLFGLGTVYYFSAVQGTVWFAAHVVGTVLATAYLRLSLRAAHPAWAGLTLGLAFATRAPLLFAFPFFVVEALRAVAPDSAPCPLREPFAYARTLDRGKLFAIAVRFTLPLASIVFAMLAYNRARFGEWFEFGYRYLSIVWQTRIERWGLFSYHYLARNLGVVLSSLPWVPAPSGAPFAINHHGLALWFTTPLYLLLPWSVRRPKVRVGLWLAAICVALPSLFYQNTGWVQFGYRFSNDFAPFLFALLAVNGFVGLRTLYALGAFAVLVNAFGAKTFGRAEYQNFYVTDRTQRVLYQPD
jgi:hypothetical protein